MKGTASRAVLLVLCTGCGPQTGAPQGMSTSEGGATETGSPDASTSTHEATTSSDGSTSTGDTPESAACATNYPAQDCDLGWGERNGQVCNWWVDDCGPDAACHFIDIGTTACVSLDANAAQAYEPCDVGGYGCAKGLMCGAGYCIPRCTCRPDRPHCPGTDLSCSGFGEASGPAVCVHTCDPIQPTCPEPNFACFSFQFPECSNPALATLPLGAACGDPDTVDACEPGTFCTTGAPQCRHPMCCSPFCAVDDPAACADHGNDFSCLPLEGSWFVPECYENVGLCRNDGP